MDDEIAKARDAQHQNTAPITGIDRDNFVKLGKAFMREWGSNFLIVRDDAAAAASGYPPSVREWAAWQAWFNHKRIGQPPPRQATKEQRRKWKWPRPHSERTGWMSVPARWPHWFDADWTEAQSHDAANRYQDRLEFLAQRRPPGEIDEDTAPNGMRYLTHPHLRLVDCPRLAKHFENDPQATAILSAATPDQLRRMVAEHAHGRPIILPTPSNEPPPNTPEHLEWQEQQEPWV